ncbi:MAG TPA: serine hydrolase [Longimicrobiales bacterium]
MRNVIALLFCSIVLGACAGGARPGEPTPLGAGRLATVPALVRANPSAVDMDPAVDAALDSVMRAGIAAGAAPGAFLVVGRWGRIVEERGFGHTDTAQSSPVPDEGTLWDLASLTKVVATTTSAMILQEQGRLDIDRPVSAYLPEFNAPDKAGITVRMLLEHRGGLEAGANLARSYRGREQFLQQINARPLAYTPGDSSIYSDWDFVLMGLIVESLSGEPLDRFAREHVFAPLGMKDTDYQPLAPGTAPLPPDTNCTALMSQATPARLARIAPTEWDRETRPGHLWGIVHDNNACALGGVSGHAGLFSSGHDLAVFAQMLLNEGEYNGVRILKPQTVATWTSRQRPGSSRALGWDTPSGNSSAGHFFGPRAFGHTGYTGTSIWIDPERGLFVVLLTNRVNPTSQNNRHEPLRRAVADTVQEAILDAPLIDWETRRGSQH